MPRHGDRGASSSPSGIPDPTAPAAAADPATSDGSEATDDPAGGRGHHGLPHLGQIAVSATQAAAAVGHGATMLGQATEAVRLSVVPTGLTGPRVLVGHVIGMHLALPAGGLHGPRQIPAWVYLFADALAIRPSDDAAMSTLPMFGLHMVLPPVAVARWLYKAGRVEHANLDLVETAQAFEAALPAWTVDDFAEADPKVQVHRLADLAGPVHVYERLGLAHLRVVPPDASSSASSGPSVGPSSSGPPVGPVDGATSAGAADGAASTDAGEQEATAPVHLKSTLPVPADGFARLWQLCSSVTWPYGLTMEAAHHGADD
jgi:hypothetical protein